MKTGGRQKGSRSLWVCAGRDNHVDSGAHPLALFPSRPPAVFAWLYFHGSPDEPQVANLAAETGACGLMVPARTGLREPLPAR
jgi:hypothetical protein